MEERRRRRVDGARHQHEALCEHIGCKSDNVQVAQKQERRGFQVEYEPENRVTIDTSMLKVDSSCTIRANDDLKLLPRNRESVLSDIKVST